MHGLGDHVLATAGGTGHQDSQIEPRIVDDLLTDAQHGRTPTHERGERGVALGHLNDTLLQRQGSLFTVDELLDDPLDQYGGGALAVTTLWDMTDALVRLIKALGTTETYQQAGQLNADVGGILDG